MQVILHHVTCNFHPLLVILTTKMGEFTLSIMWLLLPRGVVDKVIHKLGYVSCSEFHPFFGVKVNQ